MNTGAHKDFPISLNAIGYRVPLKEPIRFEINNKIVGFSDVFHGTASVRHNEKAEVWGASIRHRLATIANL